MALTATFPWTGGRRAGGEALVSAPMPELGTAFLVDRSKSLMANLARAFPPSFYCRRAVHP
jgi:hypothetical protein